LLSFDQAARWGSARLPDDPGIETRLLSPVFAGLTWSPLFHDCLLRWTSTTRGNVVIHDHGVWLPTNWVAARFARQHQHPLVISPRGMLEPWALRHARMKKTVAWHLYQRRVLQSADLLHATSATEATNIRRLKLRRPVAVIPNGVSTPPSLEAARSCDPRVAVTITRLHPKKGVDLLLKAWAAVRPAGWRLVVAGPDENRYRAELVALSTALGLSDVVSFVGEVNDHEKRQLLERAALAVYPSHSENFGMAIGEALGAGVPVITTVSTPWSWIADLQCGWYVTATDVAVSEALRAATGLDGGTLRNMGRRAAAEIAAKYSWSAVARSMHAAYEWLLGRAPCPSNVHL
jgi:glycosyltransferase involved in cell wall biosynthesis